MTGTYGCARADAAANYRMQNPYTSIGMSDRAAAEKMYSGSSCPSPSSGPTTEPDTFQSLEQASETGRGVTRPELQSIVIGAVKDSGGTLSASEKDALSRAVQQGLFARKSTAALALALAQGKITPAEMGTFRVG